MKTNLKTTNLQISADIKERADKLLSKISQYLGSADSVVSLELGKTTDHHKQGDIFRAEIHISGAGVDYYASTKTEDILSAIDKVQDEIISEINKDRGKKRNLLRKGHRIVKDLTRGFPWI